MEKYHFTDEQVNELSNNPSVKCVSNKSIIFEKSFKEHYVISYEQGKLAEEIFIEVGFNMITLGKQRIHSST